MKDDLALLAIALAAAGANLTNASQNVTGFTKQIADLQATIVQLQQQISVLSSQVTTDSASMTAQAATIAALSARIDALNAQIQTLLKQIAALQTKPTVFDSSWNLLNRSGQGSIGSDGVFHAAMTYPNPANRYGPYGFSLLTKGYGFPGTSDNLMQYQNFNVTVNTLEHLNAGQYFDMHVYVGFQYHFRQPVPAFGVIGQALNTQQTVLRDSDSIGGASQYEIGTVVKLKPAITSWSGSVNVAAYFADRCQSIGVDPSVGYDQWGVELGIEGYRITSLKADFSNPVLS